MVAVGNTMQDRVKDVFIKQAVAARSLGSPFMDRLMTVLPGILPCAPQLAQTFENWEGPLGPEGASLPLRLAGGLHALVRSGTEEKLARHYPPLVSDGLIDALKDVLCRREGWLIDWMALPPQTNEVGRSGPLLAVASALMERFGLPLRLSELGASAGLNLNFDHYGLRVGQMTLGAKGPVTLAPDWRGLPPVGEMPRVAERRGVDLRPLDPVRDAERLMAYVWPDQDQRLRRLASALEIAARHPTIVDQGDAAAWLDDRLLHPHPGQCHLVFHTVAHQYFPETTKARIAQSFERAGAVATETCPLAWFGMEADDRPTGAALTLRLWPGNLSFAVGRAGFHGQWVEWHGLA